MEMFYHDMRSAAVQGRTFRFKIGHALSEFGDDYNFRDPSHYVTIQLSSGGDADWVRQEILPRAGGGGQGKSWRATSVAARRR